MTVRRRSRLAAAVVAAGLLAAGCGTAPSDEARAGAAGGLDEELLRELAACHDSDKLTSEVRQDVLAARTSHEVATTARMITSSNSDCAEALGCTAAVAAHDEALAALDDVLRASDFSLDDSPLDSARRSDTTYANRMLSAANERLAVANELQEDCVYEWAERLGLKFEAETRDDR